MRKESANTFNEGLNFDLNPITTPNTVLTDCVNGTFITFNGDELALQNDSGNTTIMIPNLSALEYNPIGTYEQGDVVWITVNEETKYYVNKTGSNIGVLQLPHWEESVVRLSDGFYPIGIKEYGGILYIVSAKYPTVAQREFDDTKTYGLGAIVYRTLLGIKYYYESLTGANTYTLPYETTAQWLVIGTEKDFINKYGTVEFGSYPSPVAVDANMFDTSVDYILVNDATTISTEFKFDLYNPQVVNNSIFQAGVSVSFFTKKFTTAVTSNISFQTFTVNENTVSQIGQTKKYYKVKLYHQLTNGFIDLTNDIWKKFAKFVYEYYGEQLNQSGSPRFWFNDSNFSYYCPHNFKGKLVMSVELEELDKFKLGQLEITSDAVNYTVTFPITMVNNTMWGNTLGLPVVLAYTTDGSEPNIYLVDNGDYPVNAVTITLPVADVAGRELRYKLLPKFSYDNNVLVPANDYFPQQFIDMHLITGRQLIITELDQYVVKLDPLDLEAYYCKIDGSGFRITSRLTLFDNADGYLDGTLSNSEIPYIFYLNGTDVPDHPLGTYDIGPDGRATNVVVTNLDLLASDQVEFIKTLVENCIVSFEDPLCLQTTVNLTILVNKPFGANKPIRVRQSGATIPLTDWSPTYIAAVVPGVPFTIETIGNGLVPNIYNYTGTIYEDTSIKYGLITDLRIIDKEYTSQSGRACFYRVDMSPTDFGSSIIISAGQVSQTNINYGGECRTGDVVGGIGNMAFFNFFKEIGQTPTFTIEFNNPITNDFVNLVSGGSPLIITTRGNYNLFLNTIEGLQSLPY